MGLAHVEEQPVSKILAVRDTFAFAFICFARGMCYIGGSPAFARCRPLPKTEFLSWTNPLPHQTLLSNIFPSVAA